MTFEFEKHFPNPSLSLDSLFFPRSVAVIGAGQSALTPNGIPLMMLTTRGFKGSIYPVNPKYEDIDGVKCYPNVLEIPGEVDLAVITVRAELVMERLRECARKGVKAVIIFSSGFAEVGDEGRSVQEEMYALSRSSGMRIMGPNCLGLLNFYNGNMSSFFLQHPPETLMHPHFLSFVTQSGGMGNIISQLISQNMIGFNYFISTGNEMDVTFSQVLDYLAQREEVKIVAGYMEGMSRDGRLFMEACEKALRNRALVTLLKVGKTSVGAQAASSHTGALVGEDRVYDAVFRQKGVIRTEDIEQMSALVNIYAAGRLPRGKRVGLMTISGGGGVVAADKCPYYGLEVVNLSEETRSNLREFLPSFGAVGNPVDITAQMMSDTALFNKTIHTVMADPGVDIGVFVFNLEASEPESTRQVIEIYQKIDKPFIVMTWPSIQRFARRAKEKMLEGGIPVIEHMGSGLWAVAALADWVKRCDEAGMPEGELRARISPEEEINRKTVLSGFPAGETLTESRAKQILSAYGIPVTRETRASSGEEAVLAAGKIGFPVALKIESPDILHKTDAGGVVLNLKSEGEVREAYGQIMDRATRYDPQARIEGVLVQEMLEPGLEVIVGIKKDPVFGPMVLFGLGGILVELMEDVSMRAAPLTRRDAEGMIREIKGYRLLEGVRGQSRRDLDALARILLAVSDLAEDLKDHINEMDINPLILYEEGKGAVAADALIIGR